MLWLIFNTRREVATQSFALQASRVSRMAVVAAAVALLALAWPGVAGSQICPSLTGPEDFGLGNQGVAGMEISGHYAFTADLYGVSVYDLTDPANPQLVAHLLLPAPGTDIVLSGNTAFVGDFYDETLEVVDVSDPLQPTVIGSVALPGSPDRVAVGDGLVYVSYYEPQYMDSGYEGLQIVDVSDPAHPTLRGKLGAPETLLFLLKLVPGAPGVVYAGGWSGNLQTIDVSDPDHPAVVDSEAFGAALARVGDVLYVTHNGLSVVDISDPLHPELIRQVDEKGGSDGVIHGSFLLTAGSSFQIFDLSDPTNPVLISSLSSLDGQRIAGANGVALVTDSDRSLHVVDTADPNRPFETAFLDLRGIALRVEGAGRWLYVADGKSLRILDVSNPEHPVRRGLWETSEQIANLHVSGNFVYVQQFRSGLRILDVSNPDQPVLVGTYHPHDYLDASAVAGHTAYLNLGFDTLAVVDVSDPTHPVLEASADRSVFGDLWSFGSILYVDVPSGGAHWLTAWDISDPANPVVLAVSDVLGDDLYDLAFAGSYVVAANGSGGVQVFDSKDLHRIGGVETPSYAVSVEVHGHMAVVGCWDGGVAFVDIGDPEHPELVASIPTRRVVRDATVASASSTAWTAGDAVVEGVRADCVSCAGLAVSVATDRIPTGGAKTILTVGVSDLAGTPAPGQAVTGTSTAGSLSNFTDHHDGTYSAIFTSGSEPGTVQIGVSVNGEVCSRSATIQVGPEPSTARHARSRTRPADR